jgi:hypothetical protein
LKFFEDWWSYHRGFLYFWEQNSPFCSLDMNNFHLWVSSIFSFAFLFEWTHSLLWSPVHGISVMSSAHFCSFTPVFISCLSDEQRIYKWSWRCSKFFIWFPGRIEILFCTISRCSQLLWSFHFVVTVYKEMLNFLVKIQLKLKRTHQVLMTWYGTFKLCLKFHYFPTLPSVRDNHFYLVSLLFTLAIC